MQKALLARMARRFSQTVLGLFVFSLGVHFTIQAGIGLAPWDCLSMGVSFHTPLSYGTAHVLISLLIVLADVLLKEKIGFGTLLDALLVGNFVDLIEKTGLVPVSASLPVSVGMMVLGMLVMAFGQFLYIAAGLGCGPRDTLMIGLGKRFARVPIGAVEIAILAVVLLGGWALGGPIGVGTVLAAFGMGVAMQLVFSLLKFEPRHVSQQNIFETLREFRAVGNGGR